MTTTQLTIPDRVLNVMTAKMMKNYPDLFPNHSLVERTIAELEKFLDFLARHEPGSGFSPSIYVDKAWHEFILCTRAYARHCEDLFFRYKRSQAFIHHTPTGLRSDEDSDKATAFTYAEMVDAGYDPDPMIWAAGSHDSSECRGCSGDW